MTTRDLTLTLTDDDFEPQGDGDDGDDRLHASITVNGYPFHVDAWPVQEGHDPQELSGLYPDDLDHLTAIYSPDGHFQTLTIHGRECVVVMYPHGS